MKRHVAAGFALVAFALSNALAARADDCSLKQVASLDVNTSSDGFVTVPVKVGGTDARFMLEMGVAHSGIFGSVADAMKMESRPFPDTVKAVFYVGGPVAAFVRIPDLEIGSMRLIGPSVFKMSENNLPSGFTGVLAIDILSHFDVEWDPAKSKLNLFSSDHCPGHTVYWSTGPAASVPFAQDRLGQVFLHMELDGKDVSVTLSTLHQTAEMGTLALKRLFGVGKESPDLKAVTSGNHTSYRYPFKTLSLGGVTINNPNVEVFDNDGSIECDGKPHRNGIKEEECFGGSDVLLGLSELRRLHLYFAFGEKKLYATAADAH